MDPIVALLASLFKSFIDFLPKLVGSVILLIIGWVIGSGIGRATKRIIKRYRIERRITRRPAFRLGDLFSTIFSWAIYLIFIQAAIEVLEIPFLVTTIGAILAFLPGLVKAIVIVVVGYVLAQYVKVQIERLRMVYSGILGNMLFFLIIYIAIALALPQVGIDPSLLNNILLIIIGSFGLGLAIAIGLGLKDIIASLAKKYRKKLLTS
jgi:hypothetical protein